MVRHSLVYRARVTSIVLSLAALIVLGVIAIACAEGCTKQQGDMAERLLTMSARACVAVAQAKGRTDIATACGLTEDAVEILSKSLDDQVCTLPADGGAEQ